MTTDLDDADGVSIKLCRAYQGEGSVCIVIRTLAEEEGEGVRTICPELPRDVVSGLLRRAADEIDLLGNTVVMN